MPNDTVVPTDRLQPGGGYYTERGIFVDAPPVAPIPTGTVLPAGFTLGKVVECGGKTCARLELAISAKSGTSPTLDVAVETSPDGLTSWRSLGTFDQKSDVGLAMSAVGSAGTTPPAVTFTGTPNRYVNFRMECTTLGARGTAVVRYSIDGGVSWKVGQVTAATWALLDSNGVDTGLVVNYANASAAIDNVWTAKTAGFERKQFSGLDRFLRAVSNVGGSATPTMTTGLTGELV